MRYKNKMNYLKEKWIDSFQNKIPKQQYIAKVENGEERGLNIILEGEEFNALIDFGVAAGVQMLDEGVELNLSDDDESDDEFIRIRSKGFFNTIYQVRNSHFGSYIRKLMGDELFDLLNYQEYCVVTLNYVIYVISKYEPKITTVKKQN